MTAVNVLSFSYRHGLPAEAEMVFDARFLRNPHYEPHLQPHDGRNAAVGVYIAEDPAYAPFFAQLTAMLPPLLARFKEAGRESVTIAIGCTGGRHRSVFVAESLAKELKKAGHNVSLRHRDAGKHDEG
jgi:UPF0042 nucleotide-binding protein